MVGVEMLGSEGFNGKWPHLGRDINGRMPIRAITKGMPEPINTELTSQTKLPEFKAA